MDLGIEGKTALVLGGGGGLGRAIACALAQEGVNIAIGDINNEALKDSARAIAPFGVKTSSLNWDLGDLEIIDNRVEQIEHELGTVDILVNLTGGPPPSLASNQDGTIWAAHFKSMVLSVIAITNRVLPAMRGQKWGRIITSTSSGVTSPIPNLAISNALRLSLVGWSKTLSREVGSDGITANVVLPGRVATDRINFLDRAKAKRENRPLEAIIAESMASIPLARYGRPEEYAAVVAFLASEKASYVTGSLVRVDGGLIASI